MRLLFIFFFIGNFQVCLSQDSINKIYFPSGALKSFQILKDSPNLYEKDFYENGIVAGEGIGSFTNGKYKTQNFKRFYETGILMSTISDTLVEGFEEDGSPYMYVEMRNGIKHGEFRSYLNKKLSMVMHFLNGKQDGLSLSYNLETGKVSMKENFKNGIQIGPTKHYDKNGKIIKEIYFSGDCPIKAVYFNKQQKVLKIVTNKSELGLNESSSFNCK